MRLKEIKTAYIQIEIGNVPAGGEGQGDPRIRLSELRGGSPHPLNGKGFRGAPRPVAAIFCKEGGPGAQGPFVAEIHIENIVQLTPRFDIIQGLDPDIGMVLRRENAHSGVVQILPEPGGKPYPYLVAAAGFQKIPKIIVQGDLIYRLASPGLQIPYGLQRPLPVGVPGHQMGERVNTHGVIAPVGQLC